jgi:hypothetical protein
VARIRTIKPAFFRSQEMADLPPTTRLTYIGLWTYVDDAGVGVDDVRLVKADLWPLEDDYETSDVELDLALLANAGHILRYEVAGRRYLAVLAWKEHQRINRPSKSSLPLPPCLTEPSVNPHGALTEGSPQEGKGRELEGKGTERNALPPSEGESVVLSSAFTNDAVAGSPAEGGEPPVPMSESANRMSQLAETLRAGLEAV